MWTTGILQSTGKNEGIHILPKFLIKLIQSHFFHIHHFGSRQDHLKAECQFLMNNILQVCLQPWRLSGIYCAHKQNIWLPYFVLFSCVGVLSFQPQHWLLLGRGTALYSCEGLLKAALFLPQAGFEPGTKQTFPTWIWEIAVLNCSTTMANYCFLILTLKFELGF